MREVNGVDGYDCVRCLFCDVGREQTVVRQVRERGWGSALFAQRVRPVMRDHRWVDTLAPLLPGYVFVYSRWGEACYDDLLRLDHVLRVLRYESGEDCLAGQDLAFADWVWRLEGHIGLLKAVQAGDRIRIVDGVFSQLQGTILRMDRRRRTVHVALDTHGAIRQIWLAYEIVEKLDG